MDIGQAVHGTKGIPDVTHDWEGRCRELEGLVEQFSFDARVEATERERLEAENKRLREALGGVFHMVKKPQTLDYFKIRTLCEHALKGAE